MITLTNLTSHFIKAAAVIALGSMVTGCVVQSADDTSGEDSEDSSDALTSNEKTAYEFFVAKGLKNFQSAAVVGNLMQESSVNPAVAQYGGGPGRGIAQWSVGGRWDHDGSDNVVWYANKHGEGAKTLHLQLEFVWYELTTFSGYGLSSLKSSSNITSATVDFQDKFEGCGQCDEGNRVHYAKQVLAAYGSEAPPKPSKPTQPLPSKPAVCGVFKPGQGLGPEQDVKSCDGRFELIMQNDGNLVLYMEGKALWATGTNGHDGYAMVMQSDGNFVLYNPYEKALFATGTNGHSGSTLHVQNDGNLVVYSSTGHALWDSGTYGH